MNMKASEYILVAVCILTKMEIFGPRRTPWAMAIVDAAVKINMQITVAKNCAEVVVRVIAERITTIETFY